MNHLRVTEDPLRNRPPRQRQHHYAIALSIQNLWVNSLISVNLLQTTIVPCNLCLSKCRMNHKVDWANDWNWARWQAKARLAAINCLSGWWRSKGKGEMSKTEENCDELHFTTGHSFVKDSTSAGHSARGCEPRTHSSFASRRHR